MQIRKQVFIPVTDRFFRREMMLEIDAGSGTPGGSPQFVSFDNPPAPPAATPGGPPQLPPNPLAPQPPAGTQVPATPGTTPQETLDFGGRLVPATDPALKDLHKDYTEMTRTLQQREERLRFAEGQAQLAQNQVQMLMQQQQIQQQQQQVQPQVPQLTPEQIEAQSAKWLEGFYANPQAALAELVQQQFKPMLQQEIEPLRQALNPLQQERQLLQQANQLAAKYPDFQQYQGPMQQMINQQPALLQSPNGLEYAYMQAKMGVLSQQQQQPALTPEQMVQDPNIRNQIINDPTVRNEVVRQYLAGVQQQQSSPAVPPVMGNQPGGQAPMMPPNTPKNLKEGTKAFMASMGFGNSSQQ